MIENVSVNPQDANDFVSAVLKTIGGAVKKGWDFITKAVETKAELDARNAEIMAGMYSGSTSGTESGGKTAEVDTNSNDVDNGGFGGKFGEATDATDSEDLIKYRETSTTTDASGFAAGEKFEMDTSAVLSKADEFHKLYTRMQAVKERVNSYDLTVSDKMFDFSIAKTRISSNIDSWMTKFANIEAYIRHAVAEHDSLQNTIVSAAPDLSYIKRLLAKDEELENKHAGNSSSSSGTTTGGGTGTSGGGGGGTVIAGSGGGGYVVLGDDDTTSTTDNTSSSSGGGTTDTTDTSGETTDNTTDNTTTDDTTTIEEKVIKTKLGKAGVITLGVAGLASVSSLLSDIGFKFNSDGYAMIGNRLVVHCDSSLGNVGDAITLVRSDKTHVDCIIGSTAEGEDSVKFYVNDEFDEKNLIDVTDTEEVINYGKADKLGKKKDEGESGEDSDGKDGEDSDGKSGDDSGGESGDNSEGESGEDSDGKDGESGEDSDGKSGDDSDDKSDKDSEDKSDKDSEDNKSEDNTAPTDNGGTAPAPESRDDTVNNVYNSNNGGGESYGGGENTAPAQETPEEPVDDTTGEETTDEGSNTVPGGYDEDFDDDDFESEGGDEDVYNVTNTDDEVTNTKRKKSSVGPVIAGLGLAGAAGVGAKIYLDKKKENDEEEDDDLDDDFGDNEYEDDGFAEPNSDTLVTDSYDSDNFTYDNGDGMSYGDTTSGDSSVDIMDDNNTINNVYSIRDDGDGVDSIDEKLNALSNIDDSGSDNFNGSYY